MKINLTYFAILREYAGKSEETLDLPECTAHELYLDLQKRYNFPLRPTRISVAINHHTAPMDTALKSGDDVVFIAPVSGG